MADKTFSHIEIPADDPQRATRFYEGLFGWTFKEMEGFPDYFLFGPLSNGVGGAIGKRGVSAGEVVRNYVTVDSIDEAVTRVSALGGTVVEPKVEVPGQGWYAVLHDPEGNELGIWENPPA
jgi:predicted enzyme related to lactoylglutathione lyase